MDRFCEIDYLIVGHLTVDLLPVDANGHQKQTLGGTAAYAALTAHAMGLRVGVVSGWGNEIDLDVLKNIQLCLLENDKSTTFENIYTIDGRKQIVHSVAPSISFDDIPSERRNVPIVHFAPLVNEVDQSLIEEFSGNKKFLTPQGWMREWDENGVVRPYFWKNDSILNLIDIAIISIEDVQNNIAYIKSLSKQVALLIVTHGKNGAVVYNKEKEKHFLTSEFEELDPTGAGDIFSASFFACVSKGIVLEESITIAQQVAGRSVTKSGMQSILSTRDIMEIINEVQHG